MLLEDLFLSMSQGLFILFPKASYEWLRKAGFRGMVSHLYSGFKLPPFFFSVTFREPDRSFFGTDTAAFDPDNVWPYTCLNGCGNLRTANSNNQQICIYNDTSL
jgi:hypothetical protein